MRAYDPDRPPEAALNKQDAKRWPAVWRDLVGPPLHFAMGSLTPCPPWAPAGARVDEQGRLVDAGGHRLPGPPHRLIRPAGGDTYFTDPAKHHGLSPQGVESLVRAGILRAAGPDAYALPGRGRFGHPGDEGESAA